MIVWIVYLKTAEIVSAMFFPFCHSKIKTIDYSGLTWWVWKNTQSVWFWNQTPYNLHFWGVFKSISPQGILIFILHITLESFTYFLFTTGVVVNSTNADRALSRRLVSVPPDALRAVLTTSSDISTSAHVSQEQWLPWWAVTIMPVTGRGPSQYRVPRHHISLLRELPSNSSPFF